MLGYVEYLNVPVKIAIIIIGAFLVMNIVGEILEFKGKVVPEFVKIRKYFTRKKQEREETAQMLKEVKSLLYDVNGHYSADNIAKRDSWMEWVNSRAVTYDNFIKEISEEFSNVTKALKDCTRMTEEMFVENSRDRIIDFAEKVADPNYVVSHEQFRRIFRVYNDYERWLEEHGRTNGEVDMNYKIIQDAYTHRVNERSFAEDLNMYRKQTNN